MRLIHHLIGISICGVILGFLLAFALTGIAVGPIPGNEAEFAATYWTNLPLGLLLGFVVSFILWPIAIGVGGFGW